MTVDPLIPWLQAEVARMLNVPADRVANDTPLQDLGLDSLTAVRICSTLSEQVGFDVDPLLMFDIPTVAEFVAHLRGSQGST